MSRPNIFTVVLTGGIASGKTEVSDRFAALGVTVVDTDRIAHEIVEPGQPALAEIANEFGEVFLDESGRLNRAKMREKIFRDPDAKVRLEKILHPRIAEVALARVRGADGPYCLLVIPLYAESTTWAWVDRVLVVDVGESVQIERLMRRDGIDFEQARAALRAQLGREARLALADDVILNDGSRQDLAAKVEDLHRKYLGLASGR